MSNGIRRSGLQSVAKAGMTISLAALFATGAVRGKHFDRRLHTWAGISLAGFSVWHYNLYRKKSL